MPLYIGKLYSYRGEVVFSGSFSNGYIVETAEERNKRVGPVKDRCTDAEYNELLESAQNEDGAYVKVTGEVAYVADTGAEFESGFVIRCNGSNHSGNPNEVYVCYYLSAGEKPVWEGQTVAVCGQISCLYTIESRDGSAVSIPFVEAWDVTDTSGVKL